MRFGRGDSVEDFTAGGLSTHEIVPSSFPRWGNSSRVQQRSEIPPQPSIADLTRANRRSACSGPLSADVPSVSGPSAEA
jgi:hypothetical protein